MENNRGPIDDHGDTRTIMGTSPGRSVAVADSSVTARLAACRNTEPGAMLGRAAVVLWKTKKKG